jgi:hypothetical protein
LRLETGPDDTGSKKDPLVAATELQVSNRNERDSALDGPHADAESEAHVRYEEYVRVLDDVPVLNDVVDAPPRIVIRDFRRGERPDLRKHTREDPYTLREQHACDLEQRYREYVEIVGKPPSPVEHGRIRQRSQNKTRSKRRKRGKRRRA